MKEICVWVIISNLSFSIYVSYLFICLRRLKTFSLMLFQGKRASEKRGKREREKSKRGEKAERNNVSQKS